jgi:hypothetical protein
MAILSHFFRDILIIGALLVGGLLLIGIGMSIDKEIDDFMLRHGWSINESSVFRYRLPLEKQQD